MVIHPIVDKIFYSKPQISTSWWRLKKSQGITKVSTIHPVFHYKKIHPIFVDIFLSGPTDQSADIVIAWLQKL